MEEGSLERNWAVHVLLNLDRVCNQVVDKVHRMEIVDQKTGCNSAHHPVEKKYPSIKARKTPNDWWEYTKNKCMLRLKGKYQLIIESFLSDVACWFLRRILLPSSRIVLDVVGNQIRFNRKRHIVFSFFFLFLQKRNSPYVRRQAHYFFSRCGKFVCVCERVENLFSLIKCWQMIIEQVKIMVIQTQWWISIPVRYQRWKAIGFYWM